jgi:hypothetical protein
METLADALPKEMARVREILGYRCKRLRVRHNAELCGGTSATNAVLNGKT